MNKRKFIKFMSLLFFTSNPSLASQNNIQTNHLTRENILKLFDKPDSVCEMGEQFIDKLPIFSNSDSAIKIFKELPINLANSIAHDKDITVVRSNMRRCIEKDFAEENVINTDGFIFSRCEVNICVLVAKTYRS